MSRASRKWPIHFIRYIHNWEEVFEKEDEESIRKQTNVKCKDCDITAMQDAGSLSYFTVDGYADHAELTCAELQIRSLII